MRYLHNIAAHETFVASGIYRYFCDDEPLAVSEAWTLHELQGGATFIRVDEDGRDEDGLTILSEALLNPDGKIERFNVQSFNADDTELSDFKADYVFAETYVQIGRKVQGQEREYSEFELMQDAQIYIKQTVYMGYTIRDVLHAGGKANVFSPQLLAIGSSQLQKIIVEKIADETLQIGRKSIETTKYQIADDVFYWLDENFIPIQRQYLHDGKQYRVTISNYAHR